MKERAGFRAKRSLGQNFLTDEALLNALLDETGVDKRCDVLEIGPGAGDMTRLLAARCRSVTAVEIDEALFPILRVALEKAENCTLVQGDILRVNLTELLRGRDNVHVVANIPYYLTTELLTRLLSEPLGLRAINVMVQKEAAQRLTASPSTPEYGPLAVRAQFYTQPRLARVVEAACFTPPPRVDSAFVCMPWRSAPAVAVADEKRFFRLVNAAFAMRRKTLCNNLMAAFRLPRAQAAAWIARAGLPESVRGEALTLAQFAALANAGELV